jgi:two-component system cell cycle sensor histidine kinase/response regulator CckA
VATVLVVDDIGANRELLVTLLGYQGHRLVQAADGEQALAAIAAEAPDLVITDVLMPVIDGYELLRRLRLAPATRGIPVIFCTAQYTEREARAFALESGVAWVLTKPIEPEDVLETVRLALAGQSEGGVSARALPLAEEFDREHLRLLTDKLSAKAADLSLANSRLRALIDIGLEFASERDSERLLQFVCDASSELLGATYVTLGTLERDGPTLRAVSTCGTAERAWIQLGRPIEGLLAKIVAERRSVRIDNPGGDPLAIGLPGGHPEILTLLAAPITSPHHVYGWICLAGNEGRSFDADDEQLLLALAGQVGRIYENGYYYAIAQRRAQELEREIVERRRAEVDLLQERDMAQRYLDTAQVILLALDAEGRVTLINRFACDILGWTAQELLGRNWIETCLPERTRPLLRQALENLVDGDVSRVENPILTRSGEERLIEWRNTVLRDESGAAVGTLSSGADITERSRAVAALKTVEERMRFALQSAAVGIWDMNYVAGDLQWSAILEAQYGYRPGEFPGTFEAFVERVHPEDREGFLAAITKALQTGSDFTIENRAVRPDGSVRWLHGAGRILLDAQGAPLRGVGVSMDVTERRTLEAQFQQAQKMEAIGRLAGGVAHDFNNLLTGILGYCELLLADFDPNDPRQADIAEIQKAGWSAASLTRQLLAFSRKQIIEPSVLDLNAVVEGLRPMLGRLIGEDVSISVAPGADLGPILADRAQIEQIVLNLAVNARDAMPDGGALTIETANVELDENYARTNLAVTPGPYVALYVTDSGTGMSPEVQARLFEPFFTTKGPGKGTGLGLATVHGIVQRTGGAINVYSEVGKGTSFKVYFPRADGKASLDAPPAATPLGPGRPVTVMVVEDAEALRQLTKRLLERQGYAVLVAANAEEAVQLFDREPEVDLLLTDVVMPGASGPELTRKLVERRPELRVVFMSGYTEEAIVHHGVLDAGISFLQKPFTSDALARKILEALNR